METTGDEEHFDDYREQTRVKHAILTDYLRAYYHALKRWSPRMLYIDGFAGRGTYTNKETGETIDGSPLRALRLIASRSDFSDLVAPIFIELSKTLFQQLEPIVTQFHKDNPQILKPSVIHDDFPGAIKRLLTDFNDELPPTFLFVDPCGVEGTSFEAIHSVMNCPKCESFIFFNINGVNRILGLPTPGATLIELLGSRERADALWNAIRQTNYTWKREELILEHYRAALREVMGVDFSPAFRVELENKRQTSHYLIHATKHPLGFQIMKDVMWNQGKSDPGADGLELRQASRTGVIPLFYPKLDKVRADILEALKIGQKPVKLFYESWTARPDDMVSEAAYRDILLSLESEDRIVVIGNDGSTLKPASKRIRKKDGVSKVTLGKDNFVRLA